MTRVAEMQRVEQIPIERCYLCPDCHSIITSAVLCPCGNPYQIRSLSSILNWAKENDVQSA